MTSSWPINIVPSDGLPRQCCLQTVRGRLVLEPKYSEFVALDSILPVYRLDVFCHSRAWSRMYSFLATVRPYQSTLYCLASWSAPLMGANSDDGDYVILSNSLMPDENEANTYCGVNIEFKYFICTTTYGTGLTKTHTNVTSQFTSQDIVNHTHKNTN